MVENLEEGKYYRCTICHRVYKRGLAKHHWASCGHWASQQVEITEQEYKKYKVFR